MILCIWLCCSSHEIEENYTESFENSKINHEEIFEEDYNDSFEKTGSIEEVIHEDTDNEVELEFIQYGISIEK